MRRIALATAFCLAMTTPILAQDQAAIQQMADKFVETFNAGDIEGLAAMYTEDAYLLPAEAEMVQGRDNIQSFFQGASDQLSDLKLTTVDVKPLGDNAVREIGTVTGKMKGDQPQEFKGKYVVIWEKVGDEWKIATDIYNMNQ